MFFSWSEVYTSLDADEFYALCNFLENEGLKIKTKTIDNLRNRILTESLLGTQDRPVMYFGADRTNRKEYRILVKNDDEDKAYIAINKFKRMRRE